MGTTTGIEWADATVNIWTGCAKVSPACKHCYAETNSPVRAMAVRIGEALQVEPSADGKRRLKMWGVDGYRYQTANWERELRALNRKAREARLVLAFPIPGFRLSASPFHERPRVFINSLSDTFEDWQGPVYKLEDANPVVVAQSLDDVRARFFRVAEECTELDILLLTKRPENVLRMVPIHWVSFSRKKGSCEVVRSDWPSHVWIGTTAEDQEHADKRIPELLKVPAKVRFLSVEPLLGEVDLSCWTTRHKDRCDEPRHHYRRNCPYHCNTGALPAGICWVIVGGESGGGARPVHPDWVRSIRDTCQAAGVPFFFKQWGEWAPGHYGGSFIGSNSHKAHDWMDQTMWKVGKKNAGRELDGREWNEVPR